MGAGEILIIYLPFFIAYLYLFGMQRRLLEAGRNCGIDLRFLLPGWFGISYVIGILVYVLAVWMCFHVLWLGVVLLLLPLVATAFMPIPDSLYHDIYVRRMEVRDTPEEVRDTLCATLGISRESARSSEDKTVGKKSTKPAKNLWFFVLFIFAMGLFLKIGRGDSASLEDFAVAFGYTIGRFLPAIIAPGILTLVWRVISGKFIRAYTFAYMVLAVSLVSLIAMI